MFKSHLKRPKNQTKLLLGDKVLELLCGTLVAIYWVSTIIVHYNAPDTIPIHFDLNGKANLYGSKDQLLKGVKIATVIYFLITIVSYFPQYFNYAEEITEDNAEIKYRSASRTLRILKLIVIIVFLCISSSTIFKLTSSLIIDPIFLIIPTVSLLLLPVIYYILLNRKGKF